MITVTQAECHDTCLDVEGPEEHVASVNPVGYTNPVQWRVDCDCCGTCIRAGFGTKGDACLAAMEHVQMSVDDYWQMRDANGP